MSRYNSSMSLTMVQTIQQMVHQFNLSIGKEVLLRLLNNKLSMRVNSPLKEPFDTIYYILFHITGICIKDLAQILKLDKSGVSRSVEELVKKGYILRQPSEKDRRSVVLTLTKSGEERYNKIEADMYTEFKKVFSKIKKSDQDKVLEALRIYNEACRMAEED